MSHVRRVWTEAEFMALPESMDRIELIDGDVVVSPAPTWQHQQVFVALVRELLRWVDAHPPARLGPSPLDVRLAPGRIVQPDLAVFLARPALDRGAVVEPPAVAIEILSSRPAHDRVDKRALYEEAGVAEIWLVDLDARVVEVVARGALTVVTRTITSQVLPGFSVHVAALFDELDGRH